MVHSFLPVLMFKFSELDGKEESSEDKKSYDSSDDKSVSLGLQNTDINETEVDNLEQDTATMPPKKATPAHSQSPN